MIRFLRVFWPWLMVIPFWGIVVSFILFCCSGCSQMQYVPVETVRIDSVYIHNTEKDSVYMSDSTYTVIDARKDTIIITQYRERTQYRDRWHSDTVSSVRVDTIHVPVPVEKQLTRWQRWKQDVGGWCMMAVVVTVIAVVGRMMYKLIR